MDFSIAEHIEINCDKQTLLLKRASVDIYNYLCDKSKIDLLLDLTEDIDEFLYCGRRNIILTNRS
jgi:hypothetical protein